MGVNLRVQNYRELRYLALVKCLDFLAFALDNLVKGMTATTGWAGSIYGVGI